MVIARILSAALLTVGVASLSGCYDFGGADGGGGSLQESDVQNYTYEFEPDIATANVRVWWFEFKAPFEIIAACNINGNNYAAVSWSLDDSTITVNYDNSESEYYEIQDISDDLTSGRFRYTNSIGSSPMVGDFRRLSSKECPK